MKMIRVLVVDDSALVRQLITEMLNEEPGIEVVGRAADPYAAREKIKKLNPDVITLDVEMPRMDGLKFLENLMRLRPMPVVMISSLTAKGTKQSMRALELGAVAVIHKPSANLQTELPAYQQHIVEAVRSAAMANLDALAATVNETQVQQEQSQAVVRKSANRPDVAKGEHDIVIAIGASAGGTEAIATILRMLPAQMPPILIVQHLPVEFSDAFAARLQTESKMEVRLAADGETIKPDTVYLAPGDEHLLISGSIRRQHCKLKQSEPVNHHRPAVDVLFHSVAEIMGTRAIGVILTGMGTDGAKGLLAMRSAGACTMAQDEKTSVIWGMPKHAVALGGVETTLPLQKIAPALVNTASELIGKSAQRAVGH